jgi:serine/threonine protein kinase
MSAIDERARSVFFAALERGADEWHAYLEEVCGGDTELRDRVDQLLKAHQALGSIHISPSASPGPTAEHTPAEGLGTQIGPYKLIEVIGEGGMGAVYLAQQTEPVKRLVALKVIKAGMDSRQVLARFEAERQALALMDHPNIAKVLDAGTTGSYEPEALATGKSSVAYASGSSRPYFVMELVKGVPITKFCDERRLTPRERLELFLPVCHAIQHAHQKGIIHRDIKPTNVLVALYDGKPVPKVIDFGVAKAAGQPLTERTLVTGLGAVVGTPEYMSPEQAQLNQLDIDTRSDIYSLGILLYELLTGTTPLTHKRIKEAALLEVLRVIREEEPQKPSTRLSTTDELPSIAASRGTEPARLSRLMRGELDWVVMKALEKDRSRRYETANSFAMDLQRYLVGEAVQAVPPSAGYRFRKFVRRNRPQMIAATFVLSALLAGIAGTTWGLFEAKNQERLARAAAEEERLAKLDADEKRLQAVTATAAEKAARELTQKRLAQIEKGVELFAGMLRGINPRSEKKEGKPLYDQLRERAENAADQLQADEVGDPLAMARLQTILGRTLQGLGSYTKGIEVLERARAIRERELGADHPETLITLTNLAVAYRDAGLTVKAIPLLEKVRDAQIKNLGADHRHTLITLDNLGGAYREAGRTGEAIALFEQVRDVSVKKLGADHLDTLTTLNNLAVAYRAAGRTGEAIALFEQIRDVLVKKFGGDHSYTLDALANLAEVYRGTGRTADAIVLFEQVRDVSVKKLGADHPSTLITLGCLAAAYRDAGRTAEAIALFEQYRDVFMKKFNADNPSTLIYLNNLADAYRRAGRTADAIALFEQVRVVLVKKLGADHPSTIDILANMALAYRDAGRTAEAIGLYEQAAVGIEKRGFQNAGRVIINTFRAYENAGQLDKAEDWRRKWAAFVKQQPGAIHAYAGELASLGLNLLQQKKWIDAEQVLRECMAIREKGQPEAWTTFNTQSMLGEALLRQKKYADAEPLLVKGYQGMKAREKTMPDAGGGQLRIPEAIDRLIELYTATNKPDAVMKWQAERAKYPQVAPPPRERN